MKKGDHTSTDKILRGKEIPRLEGEREELSYEFAFDAQQNPRFRRWSSVYLGTAVAAIVLVGFLLLSGSVSDYATLSLINFL